MLGPFWHFTELALIDLLTYICGFKVITIEPKSGRIAVMPRATLT